MEQLRRTPVDPDAGIPDLVRRLTDDSKRLVRDEMRLAKLEMKDSVRTGVRGAIWLALAFGSGVVAMVAFTVFLATLIGRLASGHMWVGALATGVLELAAAVWLFRKGIGTYKEQPYTLPESREALKDTQHWVVAPRAD